MIKKPRVTEADEETKAGGGVVKGKTSAVEIRLKSDLAKYQTIPTVKLTQPDKNVFQKLNVEFDLAKEDCYWKGGKYMFYIDVPGDYPHKPPKVHLDVNTPIYHPNIDVDGNVCLNILRKDWSPVFEI